AASAPAPSSVAAPGTAAAPAAAAPGATQADGNLPSGENTGSKTALDENAATRDYEIALGFVKAGRYRDAANAFAAFNRTHVGSVRQPSAHFWQASSHYQLREFAKAADQYARVVAGWPNDPKAPDAMLGQANAQFELGDSKAAHKTLEALIQQYPKSSAAQTAMQRLKKKS
ncbi:MAG TPA: tol-pal system protein YbgF, partial [Rhodocyclaceae bacterium]|nr:tol-pal system protein YbgF [Rhodocyclaceae bacterium]